jgi:hypothetical protein
VKMESGSSVTAQAGSTVVASPDTKINIGELVAPWLQYLIPSLMALLLAVLGVLTQRVNAKLNVDKNAAVIQMEHSLRDALQTALENAAGQIVMQAGKSLDGKTIEVGSPEMVQAINSVNKSALDAVQHFNLSDNDLAEKVVSKIGLLTAGNPNVTPQAAKITGF